MGTPEQAAWLTGAFMRDRPHDYLKDAALHVSLAISSAFASNPHRTLEVGDAATLREALDVLDRIYALRNALSPNWRTEGR